MTVIEFANYAMVQQFVFFVLILIVKRGIYIRRQAFSASPIIGPTFKGEIGWFFKQNSEVCGYLLLLQESLYLRAEEMSEFLLGYHIWRELVEVLICDN